MALTLTIDDSSTGKALRVNGILYLEDVSDEDVSGNTDCSSEDTDSQDTGNQDTDDPATDDQDTGGDTDEEEAPKTDEVDTETVTDAENDGNTEPIGYVKLRTMMNIRDKNSLDSEIVTIYKKDTIAAALQYCSNSWVRIVCEEADCGYAYVCNTDNIYLIIGKSIYTVQKGDTIKSIAADLLGDEERYTEIKELNEFSSNVIAEGQVLLIPEV
ncbi:MAG: LysM peptidoglycan-binding domain-containing protein [Oscillospiraceae bacterium]|nr:LysM peptidoglycan-binding domain-containing protein [Oscillospiraceae bacterium]